MDVSFIPSLWGLLFTFSLSLFFTYYTDRPDSRMDYWSTWKAIGKQMLQRPRLYLVPFVVTNLLFLVLFKLLEFSASLLAILLR